jgi:hypothetical protein
VNGKAQSHGRAMPARVIAAITMLQLLFVPLLATAATNQATGSIAGDATALTGSNTVTLTTTTLALLKQAFLADGTPVTTGSTLAKGTVVKFLIYLDNTTATAVDSVNVSDVLAATFGYQAGTIKVDASQNTGATAANIYTAVNAAAALTDVVSAADVAGIAGSTISAGQTAGNAKVLVPASKVWAMLFTVKMQ